MMKYQLNETKEVTTWIRNNNTDSYKFSNIKKDGISVTTNQTTIEYLQI